MLCKVCRHCGLCPGDGKFTPDPSIQISTENFLPQDLLSIALKNKEIYANNDVALVFDIGTTTIAAFLFSLKNLKKISSYSELNHQIAFGSDVIARLSHASSKKGYEELRKVTYNQLQKALRSMVGEAQFYFQSERQGRPLVKKIIITGNTLMQSLVAGIETEGLASYPFVPASLFGDWLSAEHVFGPNIPVDSKCPVFFTPAISAFVGGDTVSVMTSCGFLSCNKEKDRVIYFLADAGTNCEMAVWDNTSSVINCTSSAAGPAFEGQGIECGMPASKGALAALHIGSGEKFECRVIGGGKPEGICGTGLLSAMAEFYRCGIINSNGTLSSDRGDRIYLADGLYISQKDIRNFQLAKGAVYSGLTVLNNLFKDDKEGLVKKVLYMAGGFGTKLNERDAAFCGMIPEELASNVLHTGNAALTGAFLMACDPSYIERAKKIAASARSINLADLSGFQELFINSLNFPTNGHIQ